MERVIIKNAAVYVAQDTFAEVHLDSPNEKAIISAHIVRGAGLDGFLQLQATALYAGLRQSGAVRTALACGTTQKRPHKPWANNDPKQGQDQPIFSATDSTSARGDGSVAAVFIHHARCTQLAHEDLTKTCLILSNFCFSGVKTPVDSASLAPTPIPGEQIRNKWRKVIR